MQIVMQLAFIAVVLAFALPVFAQAAIQPATKGWVQIIVNVGHALLPVAIPLLVGLLKKLTNMLPGPMVQVVVLVLSVVLDQAASYLGGSPSWGGFGAFAGLMAIGVHQLKVQWLDAPKS